MKVKDLIEKLQKHPEIANLDVVLSPLIEIPNLQNSEDAPSGEREFSDVPHLSLRLPIKKIGEIHLDEEYGGASALVLGFNSNEAEKKLITEEYLVAKGFVKETILDREMREVFRISGIDGDILLSPHPSLEWDEDQEDVSQIVNDDFSIDHYGDWMVCCNSLENRIAVFHYESELEMFLWLIDRDGVRSDS